MDAPAVDPLPSEPNERPRMWAAIPAGGSGTRLWPLSRATKPKFLLPLIGERSLLQQTVDRLASLASPERTLVVCGPNHAVAVARQLPDLPEDNVVVEPAPRGTGPAIGLAAAVIRRQDESAVMGSFAADHAVRDQEAFHQAVRVAIEAADAGWLVTLGIAPTRPETGFGYIERTDEVVAETGDGTAYRAARFVEKPDRARAAEYLASGRYLWNASMFIWRIDAFMAELERLQPDLHAALERIAAAWGTPDQEAVVGEVWATIPETTIDQGVMERAERVAVVPVDMGWCDVGDWHSLGELIEQDALGNSVLGRLYLVDTQRTTIWSETNRVVGLVGLENLVIVDTEDALLVADRAKAQDVRRLVDALKRAQHHGLT